MLLPARRFAKNTLAYDRTTGRFEELQCVGPYASFLGDDNQTTVDIGGGRGLVLSNQRVFEVSVGTGVELRVDLRLWWLPYTVKSAKGLGGRNILLMCALEESDLPPKRADFEKSAAAATAWRARAPPVMTRPCVRHCSGLHDSRKRRAGRCGGPVRASGRP